MLTTRSYSEGKKKKKKTKKKTFSDSENSFFFSFKKKKKNCFSSKPSPIYRDARKFPELLIGTGWKDG